MNAWGILVVAFVFTVWAFGRSGRWSWPGNRFPPGPPCLPFVGSLPFLGIPDKLHLTMKKFSSQYGPIVFFRMGWVPSILISSAELAQEVLKTRDAEFASKPHDTFLKTQMSYLNFDGNQIGMMPYSPQVQMLKKITTSELSSHSRINAAAQLRAKEIYYMVELIRDHAAKEEPVDMEMISHYLSMNMMTQVIMGKRFHNKLMQPSAQMEAFKQALKEQLFLMSNFHLADFIGIGLLRWLDLQGLARRCKKCKILLESVYQGIIDEHRQLSVYRNAVGDLVDALLRVQEEKGIPDTAIMAVLNDMTIGGTDTSSSTLQWAFMELFRAPHVLKKLYEELDTVVGNDGTVDISHLQLMPYLEAVVKEVLRLHHPTPLLLPRKTESATTLAGYYIPKDTTVFIHAWAMNRDPKYWGETANIFDPERFLTTKSQINVFGNDFTYLPFGSGRRKCSGINLGMTNVQHSLAALLHAFQWRLPDGKSLQDIDMEDSMHGVICPKHHLSLVASAKSTTALYAE